LRSFALGSLLGASVLWLQRSLLTPEIALVIAVISVTLVFLWRKQNQKWHGLPGFLLGVSLGCCWANVSAFQQLQHRLPNLDHRLDAEFDGYVCSMPRSFERGVTFDFCLFSGKLSSPDSKFDSLSLRKLHLSWYYTEQQIAPMQYWRFKARLKTLYSNMNPGSFDVERWALTEGLDAVGYIKAGVQLGSSDYNVAPETAVQAYNDLTFLQKLTLRLQKWRYQVVGDFERNLAHYLYSGWHLALTTGERVGLSLSDKLLLKESGTAHLIAISGLHVGLVFLWCYGLISHLWRLSFRLCLWIPAEKVALISGFVMALVFSLLAGFETPTQRALIALGLYLICRLYLLNWSPYYLLSLTVVLLLVFNPVAVLSEGFWLSLVALLIIFWSLPGLAGLNSFWAWFKLQVALSVGMALFSALLFGKLSLNAFFANLVAIPLVSFVILPLDILAFACHHLFVPFAQILLSVSDQLIHFLTAFLTLLNKYIPPVTLEYRVFMLLAFSFALFMVGFYFRMLYAQILMVVNLLLLGGVLLFWRGSSLLDVYFLDVGQGTSVVVRSDSRWMIYDTGFADSTFSSVEFHLMPFLNRLGVNQLDLLVVSHSDLDHSGDWRSLKQRLKVERVIAGEFLDETADGCQQGQTQLGQALVAWFQASASAIKGGNNASCLVRIQLADRTLLLTGDIETEAELELAKDSPYPLQSEVLMVPHHGSRTSSSWTFLMQVAPKLAVVTSGHLNRFGHPNQLIKERYQKAGIPLITTSDAGMIHLSLDRQWRWHIESYRHQAARFWNHAPMRRNFSKSMVN
jgi:competence protein ComEC